MGCVESNEGHSDTEEDTGRSPRTSTSEQTEQRKKKKKLSIRKKSVSHKKGLDVEKSGLASRSENAKVTVIWRRWSIFNNTHEFNKRLEGETAGPSGRLAQSSQFSNVSAETAL